MPQDSPPAHSVAPQVYLGIQICIVRITTQVQINQINQSKPKVAPNWKKRQQPQKERLDEDKYNSVSAKTKLMAMSGST